jgi:hypothetical protein
VTGPREISIPITWADNGNPVGFCPWCLETHEWTVRTDDGWVCATADAVDQVIAQDLRRALAAPFVSGLFTDGGTE